MKRRALVFGATGQDGSYLCELLLEKDYDVFAILRRTSTNGTERIAHLLDRLKVIPADLSDSPSLAHAMKLADPQEVYNLAAHSYVAASFTEPLHTADITGLGALRVFEAVRLHAPTARVYQASSSEMFGNALRSPQNEETPFNPVSPYGAAKTFAHHCAVLYRKAYRMHLSCGINFNHESERRGEEFVTRKITKAIGRIKAGQQKTLQLGWTSAQRDWSHAEDVMRAAWLMLQQETPDDYVIASGESHMVNDFIVQAFRWAGLTPDDYVVNALNPQRPNEITCLRGDSQKARRVLGWEPTISFCELVRRMVDHDLIPDAVHHRADRAGG